MAAMRRGVALASLLSALLSVLILMVGERAGAPLRAAAALSGAPAPPFSLVPLPPLQPSPTLTLTLTPNPTSALTLTLTLAPTLPLSPK